MRNRRELSDKEVKRQAEACWRYLRKPGSRGASFWATSKGFSPSDRAAILMALGEIDDAEMGEQGMSRDTEAS